MTKENIFALIKTSCRRLLKTKKKGVLKKSSSRRMFAGYSRRQKDCWRWDLVLNFSISRHFDLRNFTVSSMTFTHSKRVRNFFVDPYMGQSIQEWTKWTFTWSILEYFVPYVLQTKYNTLTFLLKNLRFTFAIACQTIILI